MKRFLSCFLCLGFVFTLLTCTNFKDEGADLGGVKASVAQLTFSSLSSVQSFSVTSGEKWTVLQIPEWIRVNQISGKGFSWTVSLISEANNGYDRTGVLMLQSSSSTAVVSVSQQGKLGVYVPVESVSLSQQELVITEGETKQLTATVSPSNASVKDVRWKSSSTSVATVSSSGLVTAVSEGTTTITVTTEDGNKTATCKVTVKKKVISVTGVSLDKTSILLMKGETSQLIATISPSNATNKNVSWRSSSTSIATVSSSGLITAVGGGTATITVTTEDGTKTATCQVEVRVHVTGVSLDKTELSLTEGDAWRLTATVNPADAWNRNLSWKSSSTSVATVSSSGLVTAVSEGTATITVTTEDGSKTATCKVTVKKKVISVTGVSLNTTSISLTEGETNQLTATVIPSNATNKNVSWKSSSISVATVSSIGLVKGVSAGTATITVTTVDGGYSATCKVTVVSGTTGTLPTVQLVGYGFSSNTITIKSNVQSDGGSSVTRRGIVWSTESLPTVSLTTKTVDGSGTGSFTSNATGLKPETRYYVRAYATNGVGTAYSGQVEITTGVDSRKEALIAAYDELYDAIDQSNRYSIDWSKNDSVSVIDKLAKFAKAREDFFIYHYDSSRETHDLNYFYRSGGEKIKFTDLDYWYVKSGFCDYGPSWSVNYSKERGIAQIAHQLLGPSVAAGIAKDDKENNMNSLWSSGTAFYGLYTPYGWNDNGRYRIIGFTVKSTGEEYYAPD